MPGKARTLLIWLGKSDRPVPTTAAPAARASSGRISGVGLAIGKRMAPGAMVRTISAVTIPGAETPMKTSAPSSTSARLPFRCWRLVMAAISRLASFRSSRPS